MKEFEGVLPAFNQALDKRGYENLTPVQTIVLTPEFEGEDLLVSAQTGSGKTVAFGLAMAPTLLDGAKSFTKTNAPLALVIAPTRELALQVKRELEWLYAISGATIASCVGGMDIRDERRSLKQGPHIVVGTPGRLRDHIERGFFDTSKLKAVILDEADEMLDMGFRDELQFILDTTPKERRTLLFSATMPRAIISMAKQYQNNAKRITTKEELKQHSDITYQAFAIAPSDRENAIINLLRYHEDTSTIIFCGTRMAVNHLNSRLNNRGFSVVALSGELSQSERTHALQSLRDGRAKVCVATDVASRGIDLPGLGLVIHADIPQNSEILLHRSGRTGRAGSKGISALITTHNLRRKAERILQGAKVKAHWGNPPSIKEILQRDHERFLADPVLSEPIKVEEQQAIKELLERYNPEQVAAALIRTHNTKRPAPEELLDAVPDDRGNKNHGNFKNSVWISLSIGRNASADPKWLLPMICGAGHLTKDKVGAIRIDQNETYVEILAEVAEDFFTAVGPKGKMEKNIIVTRLKDVPASVKSDGNRRRRSGPPSRGRSNPAGRYSGNKSGGKGEFRRRPRK
ncbi:MAG: DEAD/DEAH box helicase [Rickettsiales bacterium]|jgi:ATP-dependent RNA helicase DeaD|nr:DEAD/DEAH box helicase [Rickettsiales bacterium]